MIKHQAKTMIIFGAGNIGRSFIGPLFSDKGYQVFFIDINAELISALNEKGRYRLVIKKNNQADKISWVKNVGGILATDKQKVIETLSEADIAATAVGKKALPHIAPLLAAGLEKRTKKGLKRPLDIILAENVRDCAAFLKGEIQKHSPSDLNLASAVGLVESSIGKMVPIMTEEDKKTDLLWVFAEEYNNLILDKKGFLNPIPEIPQISAKANIKAYVDRKLFIHNLGHAAAAYLGFAYNPAWKYIYQVLADKTLYEKVQKTMQEAAAALLKEYPEDFTASDLDNHIDDLLCRFQNKALKDTIFRVGRDLKRKLHKQDRLIGAMLLCQKHNLGYEHILKAAKAALKFKAKDESGGNFPGDEEVWLLAEKETAEQALIKLSQLSRKNPNDKSLINKLIIND